MTSYRYCNDKQINVSCRIMFTAIIYQQLAASVVACCGPGGPALVGAQVEERALQLRV